MSSTAFPIEFESNRWLVDALLADQQALPAVDRFAQSCEAEGAPTGARYYRDLIPAAAPGNAEQYAFEVDLEACSGCKSCVSACHSLNGLEEDELWRGVGLLVGGTTEAPVVQHVTTACHHCIDPACLSGCPVAAYEKDPATGIVVHLDDQCIGCQYCMLKCPYDVPVYSRSKGIVRKCDMCRDRLAVGEAPACVQACPNEAIRIRVVAQDVVAESSEAGHFLPGAPEPGYTIPTTRYKTSRPLPGNLLPADYFSARPGNPHLPLVFMLILTQMSVGAFVVEQIMLWFSTPPVQDVTGAGRLLHLASALVLGLLGLAAAVFHLGRPLYAWRVFLGLKTSWLSREILAFGVFAAAATVYVGAACVDESFGSIAGRWQALLGSTAALAGVAAVICSVMIYVDTRRPFWSPGVTTAKFLLTAVILGIPVALLVSTVSAAVSHGANSGSIQSVDSGDLCRVLIAAVIAKLLLELSLLWHLRGRQHTPLKRAAMLMTGELSMPVMRRFFFGVVGGIVLPLVLLAESTIASGHYHPLFVGAWTVLTLVMLTAGEWLERYLFFAASIAPKMPGAPAT